MQTDTPLAVGAPTIRDAVDTYPCLARLRALVTDQESPFRFVPIAAEKLVGARVWPDGTTDTMGIIAEQHARITRVTPAGDRVFELTDTLDRVIDAVVERLLDPGDPRAPRLVLPRVAAGYTGRHP